METSFSLPDPMEIQRVLRRKRRVLAAHVFRPFTQCHWQEHHVEAEKGNEDVTAT